MGIIIIIMRMRMIMRMTMIMRMKMKQLYKNFMDNNQNAAFFIYTSFIFIYNTFVVPLENFNIVSFDCSRT